MDEILFVGTTQADIVIPKQRRFVELAQRHLQLRRRTLQFELNQSDPAVDQFIRKDCWKELRPASQLQRDATDICLDAERAAA